MYKQHNTQTEFVREHKRNGKTIAAHTRTAKSFQQNLWIGVPKHHRIRDPQFLKYNAWRIENGMSDLS